MIKRFWSDHEGNFAAIGALLLFPILAAIGSGIEYSRIANEESRMYSSLENAALNPSIVVGERGPVASEIKKLIDSNSGRKSARVKIRRTTQKMVITAVDHIETPLLSIFGKPKTEFSVQTVISSATLRKFADMLLKRRLDIARKKQWQSMSNRVGNPNKLR